jgi:signal transduction histidine kinase
LDGAPDKRVQMLRTITERGPRQGPNHPARTRAAVRPRHTGSSRPAESRPAFKHGEGLRFPLAALVLISVITAFGVIGHRPITGAMSPDVLVAVIGTGGAVISVVVGCVSLMRWRLVGDPVARDLGTVFVLLGLFWFVPLCVVWTSTTDVRLTDLVAIGAALVVGSSIRALRPLLPRLPTRWPAVATPIAAVVLAVGAALVVERTGVSSAAGISALERSPWMLLVVAIGAIAVLAVHRQAWMLAWGGLTALGILAGELYTARARGPSDSWALARPVLGTCAVTLALIGAGMGLRDAYLDVRSQRDRARRDLRATCEQFVAELRRRRRTSHDARSSLMAIHGAIELIEAELERHRADTSVVAATRLEVERLHALVDLGAPEPARAAVVVDIVKPVLALRCRAQAVRVDIDPNLTIVAPPSAVGLALQNLIGNAERHAPRSPIDIEARRRGTQIEIAVMDRGAGVPPDRVLQIFEWGVTSQPDGEGIGLHIAKTIATDLGGSLSYEARSGGGARFVLTLPAAAPPNGAA